MSHHRIVSEPKGGPDIVLAAAEQHIPVIKRAADILSVQGYTARLVLLDGVPSFEALPPAEQEAVLSCPSRRLPLLCAGALTDAKMLADAAREELRHDL